MKRFAVAQLGGPTQVLNATLEGIISHFQRHSDCELFGVKNGMEGLVHEQLFSCDDSMLGIQHIPGAYLGSGRFPATPEHIALAVKNLKKWKMDGIFLIGGNGTMWASQQLYQELQNQHTSIQVIGVPKTVDNDIYEIDHTPGFASAARFVSNAIRDIGLDLKAMKNFEQVRVIEVMGRNVGWLAASSIYFKGNDDEPPHLIITPERPFVLEDFLFQVEKIHKDIGFVLAVISDGSGSRCGRIKGGIDLGIGGPIIPGNVASQLSEQVRKQTGLRSRAENLGIMQRSSRLAVTDQDRHEAYGIGQYAAKCMEEEKTGVMVTLLREESDDYRTYHSTVPLSRVAGLERALPEHYLCEDFQINPDYLKWLSPLVT